MIKHIINEDNEAPSVFYYIPNFINDKEQHQLIDYLENINDFLPSYKYNNSISRYQKWYHVDKKYFCPLWKVRYPQWTSFELDDVINSLIEKIQLYLPQLSSITIPKINSCLINKYPTGENFIAPHRDSPQSFGDEPTIIGLSIGSTRTIHFLRNDDDTKNFSFNLESGSIFIMAGSSQKKYLHTIKKNNSYGVRYSLTFREFIL
jgi:hypothetical protein